ncbi:MAG TPA: ABC transporter permease [Candidatus Coprenecus pullistercoris]|nr:ABC transporter permease [Candidatus Coprenecus pullistercoris]
MDFKKIKLVLGREFAIRVKKKSFIITTIVTPILFAALMIVPSLIMMADLDKEVNSIMVVDDSGIVAASLESGSDIEYIISDNPDMEYLKRNLDSLGVYAVMHVSALDSANNVTVDAYAPKQINAKVSDAIASDVNDIIERYKLQQYDIDNFEEIMADLDHEVDVNTFIVSDDGQERKSLLFINMALSFIMGFVIYMFVTMFGNMVMTSVINEKSNKIVEVIVSSVKPFDLMIGKILGVASVALTQFFIWIILTMAIFFGFQLVMGSELAGDPAAMEQMTQMAGMGTDQMTQIAQASDSEMAQIFTALKEINFTLIIGCFLIYFVLGYLLYASMFAAIGSAVDNEADTQQLVLPVTIPLLIGLLLMLQAFQNPDSSLSFWGSIIPFTSPMVMLARIPFEGCVQTWELLLSIGLLLLTFLIVVYFSGKIYRIGILMHGTKYSWKDLWKWLKY